MFQSLRPNSSIYIFHKGNSPFLEIGSVISVSPPKPKYAVPANFGQVQDMIIDLVVKVGQQTVNYNALPSNLDVADSFSNGESIVISDNKEAMNAEILNAKKKSEEIINSIDYHRDLISTCDRILSELNPEFAEKQAQKTEMEELKRQVMDISKSMADLIEQLKK